MVGVDNQAKDDIAEEDKDFCTDHALPEIEWSPHLSHELTEKGGASIRENGLHQTVNIINEIQARRDTSTSSDRLVRRYLVRCLNCLVVRAAVSDDGHSHENDEEVHPNCSIRKVAELLECPDLADDETGDSKNDQASYKTKSRVVGIGLRKLCNTLTIADD